jgi:anti-anti-sigma factor
MKVDIEKNGSTAVVRPHGDIRVKTIVALKSHLELLENETVKRVAIDLSMVGFLDSSGLGLLANFAKRLHKRNGSICLFNYSDDVKQLLDITGIEQALALFDTEGQMRQVMMGGENG